MLPQSLVCQVWRVSNKEKAFVKKNVSTLMLSNMQGFVAFCYFINYTVQQDFVWLDVFDDSNVIWGADCEYDIHFFVISNIFKLSAKLEIPDFLRGYS